MSTICMDTCLETLSPLVICSVDNASRHVSMQTNMGFVANLSLFAAAKEFCISVKN